MSPDKTTRPTLIISDEADEVRTVRDLLQHDCPNLLSADNEEGGLRLFQEQQPVLLVLAFLELEKSERFYLLLHRQCPTIKAIAHQTLLLCKSTEAEAAFALCRNGTLDDYLVIRPMHDRLRLRLAVLQAQVRQVGHTQSALANRQLSHIGSDLRHLDGFVSKAISGGQAHQTEALHAFREFAGRLTRELDQFQVHMNDAAQGESGKAIERSGLHQQFEQLRKGSVEPDVRAVEHKLDEVQQWARQLGADYRTLMDRVGEQGFPPAQPEVLVVDDDGVYLQIIGVMLDEIGVRVTVAGSGMDALAQMRTLKQRPDIVLLDYNMPGLNGMETLKQIKADPELRTIPVVMLTSVNDRDTVKEVIGAGAADFIVKPSNRQTIVAKIRNLLPKIPIHGQAEPSPAHCRHDSQPAAQAPLTYVYRSEPLWE